MPECLVIVHLKLASDFWFRISDFTSFAPALGTAPARGPQVIAAGDAAALGGALGDAAAAAQAEEIVRGEDGEEEAGEIEGEGEGVDL